MRLLLVGDPHATVDSLDECRNLVQLVCDVAKDNDIDRIVLLGDLYHTHAVMRVEVLEFWKWAFNMMANTGAGIYALKGNHDMSGSGSGHALMAHNTDRMVTVVDQPFTEAEHSLGWIPYQDDPQEFVRLANALATTSKVLICHQSFMGFTYENGHAIEDGIDTDSLPQKLIISGHIHSPQRNGKVWYPGAPRWRTAADANVNRAIWLVEINGQGEIVEEEPFGTHGVCSPIIALEDTPDAPLLPIITESLPENARVMIDIRGPESWIEQRKPLYQTNYRIRTFRTDNRVIRVKESDGIKNAFESYMKGYVPKYGTPKEVLANLVKDRLNVFAG